MPETLHDPALVVVSIGAAFLLVLLARRLDRAGWLTPRAHRKVLHAAVGAWTLLVTPEFHHLAWALVPPVLFGFVNASGKARALMPGLAETPAEARGLWTFPLAVALTYLLFWEDSPRPAILAGVWALAFADPIAAAVGGRWGQRRILGGGGRTLEGSLAFFLVAAIGGALVASGEAGGAYPWRMGVGCGAIGAAAEAWAPPSWDNLVLPLAVAAAYRALS